MPKINVIAASMLYPGTLEELERTYNVHRMFEFRDRAAFLAPLKDKVRGIATFIGRVDKALMEALPKLEIVSSMSIGVDHIDLDAAKARGIRVTNTPDVLTDDTADLALALLLALARRIVQADKFLRAGHWHKGPLPLATKLGGLNLGVLGMGRIGEAIARRAAAMNMKVAYHNRSAKLDVPYRYYPDLLAMAKEIDVLVVACPGGAATRHLVNAAVIEALGAKGMIVNIARGSVIEEPALVKALVEDKLGGAGLDVFADEPHVPEALLALDNVVLTPHVGSATHATRRLMGQLMLDNLAACFAGKALLTPVV